MCLGVEMEASCAVDCSADACGDGWCSPAEVSASSCPEDCDGRCPDAASYNRTHRVCGDGVCAQSRACDLLETESCLTCEADCGACEWEVVHQAPTASSLRGSNAVALWAGASGSLMVGAAAARVPALYEQIADEWYPLDVGSLPLRVHALWGTASFTVAAGGLFPLNTPGGVTIRSENAVLLRDGSGPWGVMDVPEVSGGAIGLIGVWGTARDDLYACSSTDVFHYDGASWTALGPIGLPFPSDGWAAARDAVWVAGARCDTDCTAGDPRGSVFRFDGTSWAEVTSADATLRAVWGTGPSDVLVVGDAGTIQRFDGTDWLDMASGTTADLFDVWASGPNDVWAIGDAVLLHYDGTGWSPVDVGEPIPPASVTTPARVHGRSASDVVVLAGGGSMIRRFDGAGWHAVQTEPASATLIDVDGSDATAVYLVGVSASSAGRVGRLLGDRIEWLDPGFEIDRAR
ncbi:MAG: hypothetical protein M5U28_48430 [Sandaracinaceae bacterium]|nr:hypothetical protein [Sandaracinaceae bacterium]